MLLQRIVNRLKYDAKEILNFLGVFSLWLVGAIGVLVIIIVVSVIFSIFGDGYEKSSSDAKDQYIKKEFVLVTTPFIARHDYTKF